LVDLQRNIIIELCPKHHTPLWISTANDGTLYCPKCDDIYVKDNDKIVLQPTSPYFKKY